MLYGRRQSLKTNCVRDFAEHSSVRFTLFVQHADILFIALRSTVRAERRDERNGTRFAYDVYSEILIGRAGFCQADGIYLRLRDCFRYHRYDFRRGAKKMHRRKGQKKQYLRSLQKIFPE